MNEAPAPSAPASHLSLARRLAWWAFLAYAAALGLAAAALVPSILHAARFLADHPRTGLAALQLLVLAGVAILLGALAARTLHVGRALSGTAVPGVTRSILRAAQAFAALAALLGLHHLVAGHAIHVGLLDLGAAVLGFLAVGAWKATAPGAQARASLFAVLAGLFWFAASLASRQAVPDTTGTAAAAIAVVLPPGAAVFLACLALLGHVILERSANRPLAATGAVVAGLLGAVQILILALDVLGNGVPAFTGMDPLLAIATLLAVLALLAALVAAVLGIGAAGYALAHYAPPLVDRAGAGFLAPAPGAACPRCGLVPAIRARFCPDCGEPMRPEPSQGI